MMVLKFEEFINEGLWSKGIERSKTGEERMEEKIISNIDTLNGIDLGEDFLISDEYLSINGEDRFTLDEYRQYEEFIHSKGWRLPELDDIKTLGFSNRYISFDKIREGNYTEIIHISSSKTGEKVKFEFPDTQYMWYNKDPNHASGVDRSFGKYGGVWTCIDKKVTIKSTFTDNKYMVRLIKDKDGVNEGLWAKGIERSKTGEERIGDKDPNNVFGSVINKIEQSLGDDLGIELDIRYKADTSEDNDIICFIKFDTKAKTFYVDRELMFDENEYARKIYNYVEREKDRTGDSHMMKVLDYILKILLRNYEFEHRQVNEGLWAKGIERSKTDISRLEMRDSVFYKPDTYKIEGLDGWYFRMVLSEFGSHKCIKVFKKPDEKFKAVYYKVQRQPNKKYKVVNLDNFGSNCGLRTKMYNYIKSDEFVDALNTSLDKLPVKSFKFVDEHVNEGLWAKGIERSQTGGKRLEDSNLNSIKPVDIGLPFLIADRDLEVEGEDMFNMHERDKHRKFVESNGWRIPTLKDLKETINGKDLVYTFVDDGVTLGNPDVNGGECVLFEGSTNWNSFEQPYWLVDSFDSYGNPPKKYPVYWRIVKDANPEFQGIPRSGFGPCEPQNRKHIRLIKDKK